MPPFVFYPETDGSTCVLAPVSRSEDDGERQCAVVGFLRPSKEGGIISSPTFEEMQDYTTWERHPDVESALSHLSRSKVGTLESEKSGDRHDKLSLKALRRASGLVRDSVPKAEAAVARSLRLAVVSAVSDMLQVSSHDDVMSAVLEALARNVMDG